MCSTNTMKTATNTKTDTMNDPHLTATVDDNIGDFKKILRTVEGIISEGIFQIKEDGLHLVAADPAMVALVDMKLKPEFFQEYEVTEKDKAGVNIEDLYNLVKAATQDDKITLKCGEGDMTSYWEVRLESDNLSMSAGLPYLNLSEDDIPTTSNLEFTNKFDINPAPIKRFLDIISSAGDSVQLVTEEDEARFELKNSDKYEEITTSFTEAEQMNYSQFEEKCVSRFSVEYLHKLFEGRRLANVTDRINIRMGEDFPLGTVFENDKIAFRFVLAPKIEQ